MFDFDPRDHDSRDDERYGVDRHPGGSDPYDRYEDWAREHDLPYFDEQVHFSDLRIAYSVVMNIPTSSA